MERVVRNEGEEGEVEEEQAEPTEPTVPPPETVSMEIQTGESFLFDQKTGSFSQREEPAPSGSSSKKEEPEEKKTDIQKDDTAPKKEPAKRLYHGADTTGNEDDSIFRELSTCFADGYHGEWAGVYNQGYPASSQHRHMFWYVKGRKTNENHKDQWYSDSEKQLMEQYTARRTDELPLSMLEDIRRTAAYGCSDPRLHLRVREKVDNITEDAGRRLKDDFQTLSSVLTDYVEQHGVLPYCIVLQRLAARYLGAGMTDPSFLDKDHAYRSPQFSLMFWNLGNWCRTRFAQCPLPERLQKFAPHIKL
jgi:hypothetical protein